MAKKIEFYNPNLKDSNKKNSKDNKEKTIDNIKSTKKVEQNLHEVEKQMLDSLITFNNTPIEFEILRPTFLEKIKGKKTRKFFIKKLVTAQVSMISSKLLSIPNFASENLTQQGAFIKILEFSGNNKIMNTYLEICVIILEGAKEPNKNTIKFLSENLDFKDIFKFIASVIANSGYTDFMNTITLTNNQMSMKTAAK